MAGESRIDKEQARKVAQLAHLVLEDGELDQITQDLVAILDYVDELNELDTDAIEPTTHAIDLPTRYREDEPRDGLPVDRSLQNAPERIGDGFGVPKVIP